MEEFQLQDLIPKTANMLQNASIKLLNEKIEHYFIFEPKFQINKFHKNKNYKILNCYDNETFFIRPKTFSNSHSSLARISRGCRLRLVQQPRGNYLAMEALPYKNRISDCYSDWQLW